MLPPVVAAPAFAIRKPAVAVFTLDDYVAAGIMTSAQAGALKCAVESRANILVAGGTSSGKTTLTNALLAEVAKTSDRVVLIEDTRELQCKAPNLVALRTKDGVISLSDLIAAPTTRSHSNRERHGTANLHARWRGMAHGISCHTNWLTKGPRRSPADTPRNRFAAAISGKPAKRRSTTAADASASVA